MAEYIERSKVLAEYDRQHEGAPGRARKIIEDFPAADVVEVVHGRWIEWWPGDCALIMTGEEMLWECSVCTAKVASQVNYCPNCGVKMDGGVNDEHA